MKAFMDKNFLLDTPTAQHLYHDYSAKLPIIDYHCHIPPQEIYEDRRFENIAQVWLGGHQVLADGSDYYFGDHYKWRVMRSNGVPEEYITGDKPDRERFQKFAEALEMCIGNPMYTPDVHLVPPGAEEILRLRGRAQRRDRAAGLGPVQ